MAAQYVSFKSAKTILNVTPQTLRNWDKNGLIRTIRTPSGIRMFNKNDVENINSDTTRIVVGYCRCIAELDKDTELEKQQKLLLEYDENAVIFSDTCLYSNWKPNRKLLKVIELIVDNKVSNLVVHHVDVISRVVFEFLEFVCKLHHTEIIILDNNNDDYWSKEKLALESMLTIKNLL